MQTSHRLQDQKPPIATAMALSMDQLRQTSKTTLFALAIFFAGAFYFYFYFYFTILRRMLLLPGG